MATGWKGSLRHKYVPSLEVMFEIQLPHYYAVSRTRFPTCCDGRVVKALDLKSNGVSPHRFEPCSQRIFNLFFLLSGVIRIKLTCCPRISPLKKSWIAIFYFWFQFYLQLVSVSVKILLQIVSIAK